jgi:hypothetical protein
MGDHQPQSVMPFVYSFPVLVAQIWVVVQGADKYSESARVISSFTVATILLASLPLVVRFESPSANFYVCLFVLMINGAVIGVCMTTVFTIAAQMPSKYMAAIMFGQGIGAVGVNLIRIATL